MSKTIIHFLFEHLEDDGTWKYVGVGNKYSEDGTAIALDSSCVYVLTGRQRGTTEECALQESYFSLHGKHNYSLPFDCSQIAADLYGTGWYEYPDHELLSWFIDPRWCALWMISPLADVLLRARSFGSPDRIRLIWWLERNLE